MKQKITLLLAGLCLGLLIGFLPAAYAQTRQAGQTSISGTVVDESGEPVIGAGVVLSAQRTVGTVTDLNGRFTLRCAPGTLLYFSAVGFGNVEEPAADGMRVVLRNAETLDEAVVIGYGYVRKSDLTGSVGQVRGEDLVKSSPVSFEQGLQGRISGVNIISNDGAPGGGISIQIRGTNTYQGSTEPLYVIDGVPVGDSNDDSMNFDSSAANYSNALASLNPNDIASIEILKDASATAIYGSRGANGVVLITTKSGSGMDGKSKIQVSYKTTVSSPVKMIDVLSASDYASYRNLSQANTYDVEGTAYEPSWLPFPGMEVDGVYKRGPQDFAAIGANYWQQQIFRTAVSHDVNVNVSGGAKDYDYTVSGGYLKQQGIVVNSDYNRYTLKTAINKQLRPWLKVGSSISTSFADSDILKTATSNQNNGTEGVVRSAITFPAVYTEDDLDGEYTMVAVPTRYVEALNKNKNQVVRTSNYANFTLAKGLIFRTVLGFNYSHNDSNRYWPSYLAEGKSYGGRSYAGDWSRQSLLFDNLLMYNRTFGKHNVSATAGTSWESTHYYTKTASVQGFGTDATQGWLLGDATDFYQTKSNLYDSQLFSIIGRFAYNYGGKYYFTLTLREDMSSKFVKGKRGAFFPSVGVSYRVAEEEFMKPIKHVVNNLKIRYSYGSSGNQGISSYQTFALMAAANYPFGGSVSSGYATNTNNPGNTNLTWETTWQHDLGLELGLFNRIDLEVDYYNKDTKNLLQYRQTAPSTGILQILDNMGNVKNEGIEVTLKAMAVKKKDFVLSIGGNFAMNKNTLYNFSEEPMFPNTIYNSLRPYALADGHPIGSFYGYVVDGLWNSREEVIASKQFQTLYPDYQVTDNDNATEIIIRRDWIGEYRYKDLDDDGFITDNDQDWIGNANPKFFYGFNVDMNYKNFDFSILFQGVSGNDILNMNAFRYYNLGTTQNVPYDVYNASWSVNKENPTARKIFYYSGRDLRFSRVYLEDGSYLKLRTVSLGYTIRFKDNKVFDSIRLSATGNNLLTFTKYSGYDPEVNSFGSNPSLRGIDSGAYPQQRSFIFGVNLTF